MTYARIEQMKMYVWKNTETCGGSAFGGTICVLAETRAEAVKKVWEYVEANPDVTGYQNLDSVVDSNGGTPRDWLFRDLQEEHEEREVFFADGGNL
jgi:hypothetical protein